MIKRLLLLFSLSICEMLTAQDGWIFQNPKPMFFHGKVQFLNANVGYAAGGSIINKTTDGGKTWIEHDCWSNTTGTHNPYFNISITGISFINEQIGMAVGLFYFDGFPNHVMFKTTDGGDSWSYLGYAEEGSIYVQMLNENITYIFKGIHFQDGYMVTTDGGLTWNSGQFQFNPEFLSFSDIHNGAATAYEGIFITSDSGETWQKKYESVTRLLCIQRIDSLNIFASGDAGLILKSTDAGNTWNDLYSGTTINLNKISFIDTNVGFIVGGSWYDSTHIVLKTTNGGADWSKLMIDSTLYVTGISFSDSQNGTIVGYSYHYRKPYLLRTNDGGATWYSQYTAFTRNNLNDINIVNDSTYFTVGDKGTILKTTNQGETWDNQSSGTIRNLNAVHFISENNGTAVGDSGTVLKTFDGGNTWSFQNCNTNGNLSSVCYLNDSVGLIGSENNLILKTTDGGNSWITKLDLPNTSFTDIYFMNERVGFATGGSYHSSPFIYMTLNGGETWRVSYLGNQAEENSFNSISFSDSLNGIAVGGNIDGSDYPLSPHAYFICKTTDGGQNWTLKQEGDASDLYGVSFKNNKYGLAVGTHGFIYNSTNGGENWGLQFKRFAVDINAVAYLDSGAAIAVGTGGAIIRNNNADITTQTIEVKNNYNPVSDFSLSQCYPNPFNPITKIDYSIAKEGLASIIIYDVLGREIKRIINEFKPAGNYSIQFNGSELPSGIYFYRLTSGNFSITKKMILMK